MPQLLLKCADISNVVKPAAVAAEWSVAVTDEFFAQGDMERALAIEVLPLSAGGRCSGGGCSGLLVDCRLEFGRRQSN